MSVSTQMCRCVIAQIRKNENVRLRICAYAYMRMYADVWDEKGTGRLDPCLNQRASTLRKVDTLISLCPPASALLGRPSRNDAALASASSPSEHHGDAGGEGGRHGHRHRAERDAVEPVLRRGREPRRLLWDRQKRRVRGPLSGSVNSTARTRAPTPRSC